MRAVVVISDRDNVATALEPLEAGRRVEGRGRTVEALEPIPPGHKIALEPIAAGQSVVKYGSPIGLATWDIRAGAHVHTHNLSSAAAAGISDPADAPAREPDAARER